jgi:hypothetical protein
LSADLNISGQRLGLDGISGGIIDNGIHGFIDNQVTGVEVRCESSESGVFIEGNDVTTSRNDRNIAGIGMLKVKRDVRDIPLGMGENFLR